MNRKGQAAMEFLMTYGWAILVVLAAVGALAYFGVLSPSRFIPEKCYLPGGLACTDFTANADGNISIVLQNGAGFDMKDMSVTMGPDDDTAYNGTATSIIDIINLSNGNLAVWVGPKVGTPGSKFTGEFQVTYTNDQTGLEHTKTGDLVIKIP